MAAYTYTPFSVNNRTPRINPEQDQVALFIDWDNLVISNYADRGSNRPDLEVLVRCAQQYGTVVVARAYAEWNITADRLEVYKAGIEPIYAPVFHADRDLSGQTSRGKSLADPVMVTDCIDFLHLLPQVGTYVLVTGDKDMVPVVRLARLRGRRVVVIGPDYVANVLQQVSDEFISYRYLLAQMVPADPYAAYYQQQGYYPQGLPQIPQGTYTPQVTPPATTPQPASTNDRRRSRLTRGRSNQTSNYTPQAGQPYARITPPPPGSVQQPGYPYYGQQPFQAPPGYPQPELYQQPGAYPLPGQPAVPAYGQPQATGQATTYPGVQPGYTPPGQPAYQPAATPGQPAQATPVQAQPQPATEEAATAVPATTAASKNGQADFNEVKETIRQILAQRSGSGRGQMRARDLKEELLRRIPNFSERRYGFSKFKALLNAAENAGILQIDQSGHILWVSAPGTPKSQFEGLPEKDEAAAVEPDFEEETEIEEEPGNPEVQAELAALDSAVAAAQPEVMAEEAPVTVEPSEAEAALEAPTLVDSEGTTSRIAEERVTTLVEAPIGAHRERVAKPEPAKAAATPAGPTGPRPALLEQPYYEDVIVMIDGLRSRNRWLGYELLLSNVRDYLTKHMPESDAKIQAGAILSKLLNDSIIKMAIEVHSRGARKMTVKVAHLQDENPAVRYALENHRYQQQAATAAEETQAVEAPEQATPTNTVEQEAEWKLTAIPEGAEATPLLEGSAEQPASQEAPQQVEEHAQPEQAAYWGSHYTRQARPKVEVETPTEAQEETPDQSQQQIEAPAAESAAEAGNLGHEAEQVTEGHPLQAPEAGEQSAVTEEPAQEAQQNEPVEVQGEVTGEAVHAEVIEPQGVEGDTGIHVQGEPETAPEGEQPAPAGGYIDTQAMETTEEAAPGMEHAETVDGKQPAGEALNPVLELDTEASDSEEVEESEGVEAGDPASEGEAEVAPKAHRRPRRRRVTPRAVAPEGNSESMGQPAERRPRLNHTLRPHRRPRPGSK
ncbi:MAG TPA: NYN domain-containing protein [Chloroflexia bacterium]|nr:NYN domain-containing protein [Chloroflexia bacterium]